MSACPPSHAQTVLIADDEDIVRATLARMLERFGFQVLAAESGERALELGRQFAGRIDALVCDVIMPGMDGPTLAERFRELHPETAVLFVAGDPSGLITQEQVVDQGLPLLPKPFPPQMLVDKLREILPPRQAGAAGGK